MKYAASLVLILLLFCSMAVAAEADPKAGEQKAQVCVVCHGPAGQSTNSQFPKLAGQYADYLVNTLKAYKSGERANPIMKGMVAGLSEQDMRDLAAYFAQQDGLVVKKYNIGSKN